MENKPRKSNRPHKPLREQDFVYEEDISDENNCQGRPDSSSNVSECVGEVADSVDVEQSENNLVPLNGVNSIVEDNEVFNVAGSNFNLFDVFNYRRRQSLVYSCTPDEAGFRPSSISSDQFCSSDVNSGFL